MKNLITKLIACLGLFLICLQTANAAPDNNQGHHQSGITGRVAGGVVIATPTGEGSRVIPDIVTVYSDKGEVVAQVETEVQGNDWWHFDISLKPGNYTVVTSDSSGFLASYPTSVTVEKKGFTQVALIFRPI